MGSYDLDSCLLTSYFVTVFQKNSKKLFYFNHMIEVQKKE